MYHAKSIAGALGAEVEGLDLAKGASADDYAEIHRLLLEHEVLFFSRSEHQPRPAQSAS